MTKANIGAVNKNRNFIRKQQKFLILKLKFGGDYLKGITTSVP